MDSFLNRAGPYTDPDWTAGENTIDLLESSKILFAGIYTLFSGQD